MVNFRIISKFRVAILSLSILGLFATFQNCSQSEFKLNPDHSVDLSSESDALTFAMAKEAILDGCDSDFPCSFNDYCFTRSTYGKFLQGEDTNVYKCVNYGTTTKTDTPWVVATPVEYENRTFSCRDNIGEVAYITTEYSMRHNENRSATDTSYEKCVAGKWIRVNETGVSQPLVALSLSTSNYGRIEVKVNDKKTGLTTNDGRLWTTMVNKNSVISMTAKPETGASFSGWSSAINCIDGNLSNPCVFTLNAEKAVITALFTKPDPPKPPNTTGQPVIPVPPNKVTLIVSKSGDGTGTVVSAGGGLGINGMNCGSTCSISLPIGSTLNVRTTPDSDSRLGGFTGVDCLTGGVVTDIQGISTCTTTISKDTTISVVFRKALAVPSPAPAPTTISLREQRTGLTLQGNCFLEQASGGQGVNFAQCTFDNNSINKPNMGYSFPKTISWNGLTLKFRSSYWGILNDQAKAYNQPNCISNPSDYNYALGSGVTLSGNEGFVPYKDVASGISIPAAADTCVNLTANDSLFRYGVQSYKVHATVWASSKVAYAYFKPGQGFNNASGDELSCNRSLDVDAHASGISCTFGGGCTIGGKSPSASTPSANPTFWGACFQLKKDCYSRSPIDWSQCYQIAPQ